MPDVPEYKENISDDEFRCFVCDKLLAKGDNQHASLEIKCLRCGSINSIFKSIKDQVIVTDEDGVILYANNTLEETTGYTLAEVVGKKPSVWGKQMPKEFYENLWRTIKSEKKPIAVRLNNKRKDGTLYSALLRITPVFDTAGNIKFYIGMETVIK